MKKAISLLLVLVLCLSLCACGGGNDTPETSGSIPGASTPDPTVPEASQVPTAPVPTDPEPTAAQWNTVQITVDNFYDYFKPIQVVNVERNGFGVLECVYMFTHFVPRDGLSIDDTASKLSVQYGYEFNSYQLVTDPSTGEITLGEVVYETSTYSEFTTTDFEYGFCHNGDLTFHAYIASAFTYSPEDTSIYTIWLDSIVLMDVMGTISVSGTPTDERYDGLIARG